MLAYCSDVIAMMYSVNNNDQGGFINKSTICFFACFFIYLVVHFALFSREGPHWDEILDWQGGATDTYLISGRFGTYVYRLVLGEGAMPWLAAIISGLFISAAVLLQTRLLKLKGILLCVAYAGIYLACNQWCTQLVYSFQCDSVALGLLWCTLSITCLIEKRRWGWATFFLFLALGTYQSLGLYWAVLWAAVILKNNTIRMGDFILAGGVCIMGLAAYFIANKLFIMVVSPPAETIAYVQGYQKSLSDWYNMPKYPLHLQILGLLHYFKSSVCQAFGIGERFYPAVCTAVIPMTLLIVRYLRNEEAMLTRLVRCLLVLLVWFAPYILSFVMLSETGARVCLAAPVSLASLWILLISEYAFSARSMATGFILLLGLLLKSAYTNCIKARDDAFAHDLAVRQLEDITAFARHIAYDEKLYDYEVVIVFDLTKAVSSKECLVPAYLTNGVLNWYAEHYRLDKMRIATAEEVKMVELSASGVAVWPDVRCVRIDKNKIFITLPSVLKES